jgi:hypothetical protein
MQLILVYVSKKIKSSKDLSSIWSSCQITPFFLAYAIFSNRWKQRRFCYLEKYDKLIMSLGTAYATELDLDKKQTSYDDLLDAFRSSFIGYNIR